MVYSIGYTIILIIATNNFHEEKAFAETIGTISAVVEATLGLPQAYKNFENKHTEGLSVIFILVWVIGDSFKMLYSFLVGAPIQLIISAGFQLLIDLVILMQIWIYSGKHFKTDQTREKIG